MQIKYEVKGKERKAFVNALAEIMECPAVYKGVPTCNYEVDYFTIDREGTLIFDDMADSEEIEMVLEKLLKKGYKATASEYDEPQPDIEMEEPVEDCPPAYGTPKSMELTVTIPLEKVNVGNLTSLLEAKGDLIRKALGIEDLRFTIDGENISFPWFEEVKPEDALTYTKFISAICEMTVKQKRITAKPKANENEKYTFRCFLLRLGFIGDEFKADRKLLLSRLEGSSAFRNGQKGGEQ